MKSKKLLTGLVVGVASMSLALAGCSSADNGSASGGAGEAKIIVKGGEPQNPLVPANTNETNGGDVVDMLWEGLVYYDEKAETKNGVAKEFKHNDDFTEWTITLNNDRKFSDGTPVKAENFVKAWKSAVSEKLINASFFTVFAGVEEKPGATADDEPTIEGTPDVTAKDDYTIVAKTAEPQPELPKRLGYSAFYPLPDVAFDKDGKLQKDFGKKPVSNGSYKFVSWTPKQEIVLDVNDNYVGDRKAKNKGVIYKMYEKEDAAYADLVGNNIDVMHSIPESALGKYKSELGDRAINQEQAVWQSFTIPANLKHFETNTEEGQLRRAALSKAINRDEIAKTIFSGSVLPAKAWFNSSIPTYKEGLPGSDVVDFDADKAKELWKKADDISKFDGEFTLAYNADSSHQGWVEAVCNQIKNNLGIKAEGKPIPTFAEFRTQIVEGKMDGAFRTGWQADYPSPINYLEPLYTTTGSSNDGKYSNTEFDALVKKAGSATTEEEMQKSVNAASEILYKELPAIPLWATSATGGYSTNVSNVKFDWKGVPMVYLIEKK